MLVPETIAEVRRALASVYRAQGELPAEFQAEVDQLQKLEKASFEGPESSLQDLYTRLVIVSDTLGEVVEERRLGARSG